MKVLMRLPSRLLYLLPRVVLFGVFFVYVAFLFFSSYDWFGDLFLLCRRIVLRLFALMAHLVG